ncbi:hypothetical protein pb186bvf_002096 [Paramecium bursaria]
MNLVDENGEVITQAKKEFTYEIRKSESSDIFKQVCVCQESKYFATYWKSSNHLQFWKNQKKAKSIQIRKGKIIGNVNIQNFLIGVEVKGIIYIYYKNNKLINKSQYINYSSNLTFTIKKKIIIQLQDKSIGTYDFVNKKLTIFDWGSYFNTFGYCPVNDVILIPTGDKFISGWSVPKKQMLNYVEVDQLKGCQIKFAKSGKYFIVKNYYEGVLHIYQFGEEITYFKKLDNFYPCQRIQWILDDRYLLNYSFTQFQIQQIENQQLLECKILQSNGITNKSIKYEQDSQNNKKQIYLFKKIERPLVHYYSVSVIHLKSEEENFQEANQKKKIKTLNIFSYSEQRNVLKILLILEKTLGSNIPFDISKDQNLYQLISLIYNQVLIK